MGAKTYLLIGKKKYELKNTTPDRFISKDTIKFKLNDPNLKIGPLRVQVIHPLMLGEPKAEHDGFKSNNISINLCPKIGNIVPNARVINFTINPKIQEKQKSELVLIEVSSERNEFSVDFTNELPNAIGNTYFVDKPQGITAPAKKYLTRVKVDNLFSQISDDYKSPNIDL